MQMAHRTEDGLAQLRTESVQREAAIMDFRVEAIAASNRLEGQLQQIFCMLGNLNTPSGASTGGFPRGSPTPTMPTTHSAMDDV